MKLLVLPDISVKIGSEEIPLQGRVGGIIHLVAVHQAAITSPPSLKVIFDCSPGEIILSVQPKLGVIKMNR